ncbi:galectin-3b [Pleuronectes platessa]|uniref:galectin-3b n=1 Tax=Pleuronectes platessa TaxID=8262 RepID=UPI00232A362F|nr:galectin-3b [Pleuronectes platessa]XP_053291219.1 galectin-3b [Pleuronectes platessa]
MNTMDLSDALGGPPPPSWPGQPNPTWPGGSSAGGGGVWPGGNPPPQPTAPGGWPSSGPGQVPGPGGWPSSGPGQVPGPGGWPSPATGPGPAPGGWPSSAPGPVPGPGGWPSPATGPGPVPGGWPSPAQGPGPVPGGWPSPAQGPGPGPGGWPSPAQGPGPGPGPGPTFPSAPQQNLSVPFHQNLPNGVYDKLLITIAGTVKHNPNKFTVDLLASKDLAFHFNPRFNDYGKKVLVRNSFIGGSWGKEEREVKHFPFVPGQAFEIKIMCTNTEFKVAVNNSHLLEYKHRVRDLRSINSIGINYDLTLSKFHMETVS